MSICLRSTGWKGRDWAVRVGLKNKDCVTGNEWKRDQVFKEPQNFLVRCILVEMFAFVKLFVVRVCDMYLGRI